MIKLGSQEIDLIRLFENRTGAVVKDCFINNEDITIIVKQGDVGLVIGKKGVTINKLKKELGKEIHVYEHSDDIGAFVAKLLFPINVEKVEVDGTEAKVHVSPEDKKRAIGRGGKKIKTVRDIAERHFGIKKITII